VNRLEGVRSGSRNNRGNFKEVQQMEIYILEMERLLLTFLEVTLRVAVARSVVTR
jgi:hypothetical protein